MSMIATVIGGVVLGVRKIALKRISPIGIYIIWLVFVLALVCPLPFPSKISIYNYVDVERIKEAEKENSSDVLDFESEEKVPISKLKQETEINNRKIYTNYLKVIIPDIWFIVSSVLLSKVIYLHIILNLLTGNDEVREERIVKILERCKKKLKIKRNIKLVKQNFIKAPAMTGIFNVKILFTEEICLLDDVSLNSILMHELSHYKKRDNLMKTLIMVAKAFYWFNPCISKIVTYLEKDIELATDEMAVSDMNENEKLKYCEVIIKASRFNRSKMELLVGLSDDAKVLDQRVEMVLLKEEFGKRAKPIMMATAAIVLLMCFIFYPTSYGMFEKPKLFLELRDGSIVRMAEVNDGEKGNVKTIRISKEEELKLTAKGGCPEDFVIFTRKDLGTGESYTGIFNYQSEKVPHFSTGEYSYQFILKQSNNKSMEYEINIIFE